MATWLLKRPKELNSKPVDRFEYELRRVLVDPPLCGIPLDCPKYMLDVPYKRGDEASMKRLGQE